jgi:hypothetical protein
MARASNHLDVDITRMDDLWRYKWIYLMNEITKQQLIDNANKANQYTIELTPVNFRNGEIPTQFAVRWHDKRGNAYGKGYLRKQLNPRLINIGLERCPACNKDNYAHNISHGFCTWCPFDANKSVSYLRGE